VVSLKDRFSFGLKLPPALLGLGEVLPGVFAWLPRIICGRRAGAGVRRGHIIGVLLVIEDQDHFTIEPIERGHLLWLLAVVEIGNQLLHCVPCLSDRACYNEFVHHNFPPYTRCTSEVINPSVHLVGKSISVWRALNTNMAVKKIGVSLDEKTYEAIKAEVETKDYRNISHFMERAAELLLEKRLKDKGQGPCKALTA